MTNNTHAIEDIVLNLALIEDLGFPFSDVTTDWLFPDSTQMQVAQIISKHREPIVICGLSFIQKLFAKLTPTFTLRTDYQDGDYLAPRQSLLTIEASAQVLFRAERVVLNFLRHLCAIATLTSAYVARVKTTPLKILDTRKTTPGLRTLEKHAVYCGGGVNHRMGLYDAIMIKDTHIDALNGMANAMDRLVQSSPMSVPVIVEVRTVAELEVVLKNAAAKVTRVLLDNMPLAMMQTCVQMCEGLVETEASGNIHLDNVLAIAQTGVQYASVGALTYQAGQVDLSMYSNFAF